MADAIYRVENIDRYDDQLIVSSNLIESYDKLMEFVAKHTSDKFHLIDNTSVSLRDLIAREIVSNILVHRDYTSAFPAKLIIEKIGFVQRIGVSQGNMEDCLQKSLPIELQYILSYPLYLRVDI